MPEAMPDAREHAIAHPGHQVVMHVGQPDRCVTCGAETPMVQYVQPERQRSGCPSCGEVMYRTVYDIGSGPELACSVCEWAWGANGQDLQPIVPVEIRERLRMQMEEA